MEINPREVEAMVYLLEDTDETVLEQVESKLISLGRNVIPYLENIWATGESNTQKNIEDVIQKIYFGEINQSLGHWASTGGKDLLEGMLIINHLQYPEVNRNAIENQLDKIRLNAWLELHYDLTPIEKIRILNHVFFEVYRYAGNKKNYHSPDNSFISRVLETRLGNPITLSIIYQLVAHKLNIPVFGVNLPQHFILAYMEDSSLESIENFGIKNTLDVRNFKTPLFYINPFSNGQIFGKNNIDEFLSELKFDTRPEFFKPCNNVDIIKRVLRNLRFAFSKEKKFEKLKNIETLMLTLGMQSELRQDAEEQESED